MTTQRNYDGLGLELLGKRRDEILVTQLFAWLRTCRANSTTAMKNKRVYVWMETKGNGARVVVLPANDSQLGLRVRHQLSQNVDHLLFQPEGAHQVGGRGEHLARSPAVEQGQEQQGQ